jgi:hypothetical protein
MDPFAALPSLLPAAIAWAKEQASRAIRDGEPLSVDDAALASRVGVRRPDLVRIVPVDELPEPADPALREAAERAGLLAPQMIGLTLGHALFIRRGHLSRGTLSHELRHVAQYESAGGIESFLPVYLRQIVEFGYAGAPLEADARRFETE